MEYFTINNPNKLRSIDAINNRRGQHLKRVSPHEFSVAHYTGKLTYDAREFENINRDFVPPEMVTVYWTHVDIKTKKF